MNVPGIVLLPAAGSGLDSFLTAPSHALLLAGPNGTGKTQIADTLAMQLLGAETLENQAYYRAVVPKNGTITIEQVRELIKFFRLKVPGTAAVQRVAVLQDADAMGREAQNALLKLLEEPPAGSVLILTSSQPQGMLQTVRSRVQLLNLGSPTIEQLQKHFVAAGHDESAVSAALLRSGADIAEAERLLSSDSASDSVVALVKQALGGTSYDRMLLVDGLAKQKDAASSFVDTLATVAMASLPAAASRGAATVDRWKNVLQVANTAQGAIERNGNTKLVLTELMLAL